MAEKKIYPHANHRRRVRESFRSIGADNMPDRSLLELLLFYSIPRRDTNALAGKLLEKYGSLSEVLNAPYDELIQIEGMGESSALLLTMLPGLCRRYMGKTEKIVTLSEPAELMKFITEKFEGLDKEMLLMVCLDPLGNAISCKELAKGDETSVTADKRTILETAFNSDADSVILAHNHPKGDAAPSKEDIELTKETARLLRETGIKLSDHIIIGKEGALSLASTAKFSNLFV